VKYNCLSWVLGIKWAVYAEDPRVGGYEWFPGIDREWTFANIRKIFAKHGYIYETDDRSYDPFWQKVAFYCDHSGVPIHFARQLESGFWTSKIGRLNDITHFTLECLEASDNYGPIKLILMRKREYDDPEPAK
jgi:hypothetical protein